MNPGQYHELLVHQNREKIEQAAVKAFEQRLETPLVMVLDPADPAAKAIAAEAGLGSRIEEWVSDIAGRGVTPILIWPIPARVALALLNRHYPEAAGPLTPLTGDQEFYAAVVAMGAVTIGQSTLP